MNSNRPALAPNNHPEKWGNKASCQWEMSHFLKEVTIAGLNASVPEFFVLNDDMAQNHVDQHCPGWRAQWAEFQIAQGDATDITPRASQLLAALRQTMITTFEQHPLTDASLLTLIALLKAKNQRFIIRSTGEEDTDEVANPGGNESISGVEPDILNVSATIGRIIASYLSEKSLKQRLLSPQHDITQKLFMATFPQRLITEPVGGSRWSHAVIRSGVMYVQHGMVRIQAAPGHGELIVNSRGAFDTFVVTRENMVYPEIAIKTYRYVLGADGLVLTKNSKSLQQNPVFALDYVVKLAELGRAIEAHYQKPMDIEFVYEPAEEMLYVVQARPIPQGDLKRISPSSIPPEKIPAFKAAVEAGRIHVLQGELIAPAGYAATLITHKDQLFVGESIEEALNTYLAQKNSPIKGVIVRRRAPMTSHEAAQFNVKAIPVLQLNQLETVRAWMDETKAVTLDPQRNQLIDWREQKPADFLKTGFFTAPVTAHTPYALNLFSRKRRHAGDAAAAGDTLGKNLNQNPNAVLKKLFAQFNKKQKIGTEHVYTDLLSAIETVESAAGNDSTENAREALRYISLVLYTLAKKYQGAKNFVPRALLLCEEIDICLAHRQEEKMNDEMNTSREAFLQLVAKLKSFAVFPGHESVLSHSVIQVIQEEKLKNDVMAEIPESEGLPEEAFSYFCQFVKLRQLAMTDETSKAWGSFSFAMSALNSTRQKLAAILKFAIENKLEFELINTLFKQYETYSDHEILDFLHEDYRQTSQEIANVALPERRNAIRQWETRIGEWTVPHRFDELWESFTATFIPLTEDLTLNASMTPLTKKAILRVVKEWVDVMDRTIKTMKGSPEYTDQERALQVKRFALMLNPYHQLMRKWMSLVPEAQYQAWATAGNRIPENILPTMLKAIDDAYRLLAKQRKAAQLLPSGTLSIPSVRMGSAADFGFQFGHARGRITLEDLFSLIHQNLMASIVYFMKETGVDHRYVPPVLKPLVEAVHNAKGVDWNSRPLPTELLSIDYSYPLLRIEYNLPLRNHAGQFSVEYDATRKKAILFGMIFGHEMDRRMAMIVEFSGIEGKLLGLKNVTMPCYDANKEVLEFAWEMDESQIATVAPGIQAALSHYASIAYGIISKQDNIYKDFLRRQGNFSGLYPLSERERARYASCVYPVLFYLFRQPLNALPLAAEDVARFMPYERLITEKLNKLLVYQTHRLLQYQYDFNSRSKPGAPTLFERHFENFKFRDVTELEAFVSELKVDLRQQKFLVSLLLKQYVNHSEYYQFNNDSDEEELENHANNDRAQNKLHLLQYAIRQGAPVNADWIEASQLGVSEEQAHEIKKLIYENPACAVLLEMLSAYSLSQHFLGGYIDEKLFGSSKTWHKKDDKLIACLEAQNYDFTPLYLSTFFGFIHGRQPVEQTKWAEAIAAVLDNTIASVKEWQWQEWAIRLGRNYSNATSSEPLVKLARHPNFRFAPGGNSSSWYAAPVSCFYRVISDYDFCKKLLAQGYDTDPHSHRLEPDYVKYQYELQTGRSVKRWREAVETGDMTDFAVYVQQKDRVHPDFWSKSAEMALMAGQSSLACLAITELFKENPQRSSYYLDHLYTCAIVFGDEPVWSVLLQHTAIFPVKMMRIIDGDGHPVGVNQKPSEYYYSSEHGTDPVSYLLEVNKPAIAIQLVQSDGYQPPESAEARQQLAELAREKEMGLAELLVKKFRVTDENLEVNEEIGRAFRM